MREEGFSRAVTRIWEALREGDETIEALLGGVGVEPPLLDPMEVLQGGIIVEGTATARGTMKPRRRRGETTIESKKGRWKSLGKTEGALWEDIGSLGKE